MADEYDAADMLLHRLRGWHLEMKGPPFDRFDGPLKKGLPLMPKFSATGLTEEDRQSMIAEIEEKKRDVADNLISSGIDMTHDIKDWVSQKRLNKEVSYSQRSYLNFLDIQLGFLKNKQVPMNTPFKRGEADLIFNPVNEKFENLTEGKPLPPGDLRFQLPSKITPYLKPFPKLKRFM